MRESVMFERMKDKVKEWAAAVCCHRNIYAGLTGCHGFAAWATEKPEIYLPMAALYLVQTLKG